MLLSGSKHKHVFDSQYVCGSRYGTAVRICEAVGWGSINEYRSGPAGDKCVGKWCVAGRCAAVGLSGIKDGSGSQRPQSVCVWQLVCVGSRYVCGCKDADSRDVVGSVGEYVSCRVKE